MAVGQIEAGGFYPRFCGMYGTSAVGNILLLMLCLLLKNSVLFDTK